MSTEKSLNKGTDEIAERIKEGETVVITGASAGVGRATALAFARRGARIGLIARNQEALTNVAQEVELLGGRALVLPLDVADAEAVEAAADKVEQAFGDITIWVNNAMATVFSPIKEMSAEDFRRVTEVTYLGYVHGTLSALRRMLPRDSGTIIQVSSALAFRAIPLQAAYCAAKHAIKGFSESLVTELLHDKSNVKVCLINLPAMNTPQFTWAKSRMPNEAQPVPPIYQPEIAAEAIVRAVQHQPRQMNVAAPVLKAIIAETIAPQIADQQLAKMGYRSQLRPEPKEERSNNLWQPMDLEYYRVHGPFDRRARSNSLVLQAEKRPRVLYSVVAASSALLIGALFFRKHRAA